MIQSYGRDTPIGFIGLGVMGAGMARRLIEAGYPVTVHNRTREREAGFAELGARRAASPREAATGARVLILSLPETAHVREVLFGPDGAAQALEPGACVIDTSTIEAAASRNFAARLAERGVQMLDAPVSGGKEGAEKGTLTCMVGGPQAMFEACAGIASAISARYLRMGDHGAGQVAKCCNQIAVAGAMSGVIEALALARKQGVDPAVVREVLLGGAAKTFVLEKHGQRLIDRDFAPGFAARLMRKDLRLASDAGRDGELFLPGLNSMLQLLEALCAQGGGDLDWSAVGTVIERQSGLDLPVP